MSKDCGFIYFNPEILHHPLYRAKHCIPLYTYLLLKMNPKSLSITTSIHDISSNTGINGREILKILNKLKTSKLIAYTKSKGALSVSVLKNNFFKIQ